MGSAVQPHGGLPPMWLGVLKTAYFAGFKRRHSVPAHFAGACGALARQSKALFILSPLVVYKRPCYSIQVVFSTRGRRNQHLHEPRHER
jgi:hypothetical protein